VADQLEQVGDVGRVQRLDEVIDGLLVLGVAALRSRGG